MIAFSPSGDVLPDRCCCAYSQSTRSTTRYPFGRLVRVLENPDCPEHSDELGPPDFDSLAGSSYP
jgi:hypothetical protein